MLRSVTNRTSGAEEKPALTKQSSFIEMMKEKGGHWKPRSSWRLKKILSGRGRAKVKGPLLLPEIDAETEASTPSRETLPSEASSPKRYLRKIRSEEGPEDMIPLVKQNQKTRRTWSQVEREIFVQMNTNSPTTDAKEEVRRKAFLEEKKEDDEQLRKVSKLPKPESKKSTQQYRRRLRAHAERTGTMNNLGSTMTPDGIYSGRSLLDDKPVEEIPFPLPKSVGVDGKKSEFDARGTSLLDEPVESRGRLRLRSHSSSIRHRSHSSSRRQLDPDEIGVHSGSDDDHSNRENTSKTFDTDQSSWTTGGESYSDTGEDTDFGTDGESAATFESEGSLLVLYNHVTCNTTQPTKAQIAAARRYRRRQERRALLEAREREKHEAGFVDGFVQGLCV